jgi:[histone H3]-lysine79 N-trimethyltransferase
MWGLSAGPVTLREGDFCDDNEVVAWIRKADVILVNNYIFSSDRACLVELPLAVFKLLTLVVNDALTWRFLDLLEGAKVVVLKPFWPINRPLTQRTVSCVVFRKPKLCILMGSFLH